MKTRIKQGNPFRFTQTLRQVSGISGIRSSRAKSTRNCRGHTSTANAGRSRRFLRYSMQTVDLQQLPFPKIVQRSGPSTLILHVVRNSSICGVICSLRCYWRYSGRLTSVTVHWGSWRCGNAVGWIATFQFHSTFAASDLFVQIAVLSNSVL